MLLKLFRCGRTQIVVRLDLQVAPVTVENKSFPSRSSNVTLSTLTEPSSSHRCTITPYKTGTFTQQIKYYCSNTLTNCWYGIYLVHPIENYEQKPMLMKRYFLDAVKRSYFLPLQPCSTPGLTNITFRTLWTLGFLDAHICVTQGLCNHTFIIR